MTELRGQPDPGYHSVTWAHDATELHGDDYLVLLLLVYECSNQGGDVFEYHVTVPSLAKAAHLTVEEADAALRRLVAGGWLYIDGDRTVDGVRYIGGDMNWNRTSAVRA